MRRRFLTVIAVVFGGIAALAVLLAIRGSLIAGFVREIAESRLSTAIGQPVAIGQLGFSLIPRPAFTGSDIRVGDTAQQAPAVSLDRVEVFPVLRSFLQGPIHITEVSLDGFTVSLLRGADGRWRAPAVFPAPTRGAGGGIENRSSARRRRDDSSFSMWAWTARYVSDRGSTTCARSW